MEISEFSDKVNDQRWRSEDRVYAFLKTIGLGGCERNYVIDGKYIADFAFPELKLVIEANGTVHQTENQRLKDAKRTEWFKEHGWTLFVFDVPDSGENLVEAYKMLSYIHFYQSYGLTSQKAVQFD